MTGSRLAVRRRRKFKLEKGSSIRFVSMGQFLEVKDLLPIER